MISITKFKSRVSKKIGLAPGSLVHIGEERTEKPKITIIDYDRGNYLEKVVENAEECFPFKDSPKF